MKRKKKKSKKKIKTNYNWPKTTDKKKSAQAKRNRTNGHNFERECADELKSVFPEVKRHLEYQVQEAMGIDLDNTGPFLFQCKYGKRHASPNVLDEIQSKEIMDFKVVLTRKTSESEIYAILTLEDLKVLINDYINY